MEHGNEGGAAGKAAPAGSHGVFHRDSRDHSTVRNGRDELERARAALGYIDPHDHDTWLRVGMALHSAFGDDAWPIFDEWSAQSENYDARENRQRWSSFKPGGSISIGTLFGMARNNGWRDDGTYRLPDPEELERRRRDRARQDAEAARKRDCAAAETAKKAAAIWSSRRPVSADNPYCQRKGIEPNNLLGEMDAGLIAKVLGYEPSAKGRALSGPLLVVPIKRDGKLSTLQLIDGDGRKHFLADGTLSGGYWATGSLPDNDGAGLTLLLGEGVATVLSAQQAMPAALGVAAMSNGNIPKVAHQMRERFPRADIVVLADVHKETGVPDRYAADAARDIAAMLAVPRFEEGPAPDRKDFNDLMRVHGPDAVLAALRASVIEESAANAAPKPKGGGNTTVTLVRAVDITPEPIDWIWDGFLARRKVHLLAGKPSAGKTTLAIIMAATVSTGGTWPDGSRCKKGRVIMWTGEDDLQDTLVPRLMAAGADLERVEFVKGATEDGEPIPFDPARHLPALAKHIETTNDVALLIVDPVVSAVAGDSHKNTEVRRSLQPLVDLAEKTGCAVLGITHFTKGTGGKDPVERLTGSLAFGAVARVVLVAAKTEDDDGGEVDAGSKPGRVMMRAKSNIGPDGGGFAYDLERRELPCANGVIVASLVRWGEAVHGSARDILADAEEIDPEGGSKLEASADWLSDLLADGPVAASEVKARAKAAGHAWKTVKRAKERLCIVSQKEGMNGGWIWFLPRRDPKTPEGSQQNLLGPFDRVGPLRADDDADDIVEGAL